jgi:hypothetical protein
MTAFIISALRAAQLFALLGLVAISPSPKEGVPDYTFFGVVSFAASRVFENTLYFVTAETRDDLGTSGLILWPAQSMLPIRIAVLI